MSENEMSVSKWRQDFSVFQQRPDWAYFDSAASCQVPEQVLEGMLNYQREQHANVHRGSYQQSQHATALYESWRVRVAGFIGTSADQLIFTRGTTESMNLLADSLARPRVGKGDNIVISLAEHHANWLPWERVCREAGAELRVVPLNEDGTIADVEPFLDERTRVLSVTHASNVLGVINPVADICALARSRGILSVVDAAQSAAHINLDVTQIDCDALAFSAHKIYGPTGIGALFIKSDVLQDMPPWQVGGGMVDMVYENDVSYLQGVSRFEAGTPNLIGAAGFAAAVEYLQQARNAGSTAYLNQLFNDLLAVVERYDWLQMLPHSNGRIPVLSVHSDKVHPRDLAMLLDESGIAARAGRHCAQPLINALTEEGCLRFSLGLYSQRDDILRLAAGLDNAADLLL
ncbi:cysteine desulfurase CsdA [Aliidiomarina minuta]|uniref:Probable cysteine desulfurase n=2 Tax=Aliidiomarina minuta TaxID=880057 RepID=A0A432W7W6_9GAMM|nr:cysteine desulfurase CsdA [Aliidiomarina minuta]